MFSCAGGFCGNPPTTNPRGGSDAMFVPRAPNIGGGCRLQARAAQPAPSSKKYTLRKFFP